MNIEMLWHLIESFSYPSFFSWSSEWFASVKASEVWASLTSWTSLRCFWYRIKFEKLFPEIKVTLRIFSVSKHNFGSYHTWSKAKSLRQLFPFLFFWLLNMTFSLESSLSVSFRSARWDYSQMSSVGSWSDVFRSAEPCFLAEGSFLRKLHISTVLSVHWWGRFILQWVIRSRKAQLTSWIHASFESVELSLRREFCCE